MNIQMMPKQDLFITEEEEEQYSIVIKPSGQKLFMNKQAMEILNTCYEFDNIEDALGKYIKRYPNENIVNLKQDFESALRVFDIYNILYISSETENLLLNYNKGNLNFSGDLDYKKVSAFIQNNLENQYNFKSPYISDLSVYDPVQLRFSVLTNKGYCLQNVDESTEKINFVLILDPPEHMYNQYIVKIHSMITSLIDENKIKYILKESIDFIKHNLPFNFSKLRFNLIDKNNVESIDKIKRILEDLDFVLESKLKNEFGNSDLYIYSLFLENE